MLNTFGDKYAFILSTLKSIGEYFSYDVSRITVIYDDLKKSFILHLHFHCRE